MSTTDLTILDQIIVRKRAELVADRAARPQDDLEAHRRPSRRGFRDALLAAKPAIISEVKKASPSEGVIKEDFDPFEIAASYDRAGAACLSVLTDKQYFQGSLDDLIEARTSVRIPVLRKDFTLDRYHVLQASEAGADCILLIVAALSDEELKQLLADAKDLALDALVEVHNEEELSRAIDAGANLIGVNNRNLKTLEVSLDTSFELAAKMPQDVVRVTESGIRTPEHIRDLMAVGYQAFLIGTSLMRRDDPGAALAELIAASRA